MKAVRIHEPGGIDKLRYEDVGEPQLGAPGQAIVKLKAAALNRFDIALRRGSGGFPLTWPIIPGCDGAGTVVAVGDQVTNLRPGDAVCLYPIDSCGECQFCLNEQEFNCVNSNVLRARASGTYAHYICVSAHNCFPLPQGFSFAEAAALPLTFSAAWRMLVTHAELRPGEWLLIRGIGGGVAAAALQIATALGARVIVTSRSEEKLAMALRRGAEHGIVNGKSSDVAAQVRAFTRKRGVDVAVDCIGGASWPTSLACLAKGGRLVTCGAMAEPRPQTDVRRLFWNHLKIFGSTCGSRREFGALLDFIRATGTKPIIDGCFELKDAGLAQKRLEDGKQFGKIVLAIDG